MRLINLQRLTCLGICILSGLIEPASAAPVTWNGWTFDFEVGVNNEGLALKNVKYQTHTLIKKVSLPLIEGQVDGSTTVCPKYQDKLDNVLTPMPWANNATISQRQFNQEGRLWYEIGIYKKIDTKEYFQAYYLSSDGLFDAHLFTRGEPCVGVRESHPHYRIDLDVDGAGNDRFEDFTFSPFSLSFTPSTVEANQSTTNIHPINRDTVTNNFVTSLNSRFPFKHPDGNQTMNVEDHEFYYTFINGGNVLYKASEDVEWLFNPPIVPPTPYINGENINGVDIVNWYHGTIGDVAPELSNYPSIWNAAGVLLAPSWVTTALPDVTVSGGYWLGHFEVYVKNEGIIPTPVGKTVGIGIYVDGVYKTWLATNTPIKPGEIRTLTTASFPLQRYLLPSNGNHTVTFWVDDLNRFPESNEGNNKYSTVISDTGPDNATPYVAITSPANDSTVSGSTVVISAKAFDNYAIKSVVFSLSDSQFSEATPISPAKKIAPYVFSWDSTTVAAGNYWLTATATDTSGWTNSHAIPIKVVTPATITRPDLVVTNVAYANGQFNCTVKNNGTAGIPAQALMTLGFYVDGVYRNWTSSYGPLAAGASVNLVSKGAPYNVPAGSHTFKAHIDDQNLVMEGNETNNTLSKTITVP